MPIATPPDRHGWAVAQLGLRGGERVLEIGCGHGVALSLILEQLGPKASAVGVDRSPKMIAAAMARNAEAVAAGRLRLLTGSFEQLNLGEARFDRVFAANVDFAVRGAGPLLGGAARAVAPEGWLLWVMTPPGQALAERFARTGPSLLRDNGWTVLEVVAAEIAFGPAIAVRAAPQFKAKFS